MAEYYVDNRDKIFQYQVDNKDKISEQKKVKYQQDKDLRLEKAKERIPCPVCSKILAKSSMWRHIKNIHP